MNAVTSTALLSPPASQPRLCLLAHPRICRAALPDHLLERRDAALLARLALHGPLARTAAAQWLWPDLPPAKAQANLRQRLLRLRQSVAHELVLSTPALQLAPGLVHDLAHDLVHDPVHDPVHDLAPADLLGALDYSDCGSLADWVDQTRTHWLLGQRSARAGRVQQLERGGHLALALTLARQALIDEPSSEPAHRQVMRLHYLQGDRAAGLAAFAACTQALQHALQASPGPETTELAALLQSGTALTRPTATTTPFNPLALQRPPRLVGRTAEWAALQAAWQPGAVLLLVGEAGIGKTRLAGDFLQARGGGMVIKARVGDTAEPYTLCARLLQDLQHDHGPLPAALRQAFSALLPDPTLSSAGAAGAAPDSSAAQQPAADASTTEALAPLRLRQALVAAMRFWAGAGLLALWVDDLQFADAASLDLLLGWLGDEPAEPGPPPGVAAAAMPDMAACDSTTVPILRRPPVLLTLRPDPPGATLPVWLAEPPGPHVTRLALGPLLEPALLELLHTVARPGLSLPAGLDGQTLLRRCGGNPLYALELLRAAAATPPTAAKLLPATPEPLRPLLLRRLARLDAPALRLARLAAVAGPDFSVTLAAEVLQVHALDLVDPWQALAQAQVLDSAGWVFDLMQETLLGAMPVAITLALHGGIARVLQQRGAAPARVARHAWLAQDWALAANPCQRAADAALALARPKEALDLLDQAVLCHQRSGNPAAAFAAQHRALDAAIVVDPGTGMARRVNTLLAAAASPSQRLDALLALCRHHITASDWIHARVPAREALHLAQQLGDLRRTISAASWHAIVLALDGDRAQALALFDQHAAQVQALADPRVQLEFAANHGYTLYSADRYADALRPLRQAVTLAEQQGNLAEAVVQLANIAICLLALGDVQGAILAGEQGMAFWRRQGEPSGSDACANQMELASNYSKVGRYAEALPMLTRVLAQFRAGQLPAWAVLAEHRLARLYLHLGQPGLAGQVLTTLHDTATEGNRLTRLLLQIRISAAAGGPKPTAAVAKLAQAVAQLSGGLPMRDRAAAELLLASWLPAAQGLAVFERVHHAAVAAADLPVALAARIRQADALRRLGQLPQAAALADAALQAASVADPLDMERMEFCWLAVQALDAASHSAAADQALQAALRWVHTTQAQVPPVFVDSFRQRNLFNRALLARAAAGAKPNA